MSISPQADGLKWHDFAHEFRAKSLLVDVFFRSVDDLFELNYLLGLLNRQNIKHEVFAFPCHCGSLLLQCIAFQWIGSSPVHPYC